MRKTALLILGLAICVPGFSKHKKSKKKKQLAANEIQSVTIHRTTCFGRCPDYFIELKRDGTVTYTGIRFTEDTGIFQKNIGNAAAMVLNDLASYKPDTCQDQYVNRIPDLPGLIYIIKYGNKTKTIHTAQFGPVFLQRMAEKIDEAGKKTDNTWKKVGMPDVKY